MKIEIYIYEEKKAESFYKKAVAEYEKRLSRYCPVAYKVLRKEKEWIKLMEQKKEGFYLCPGDSISSETFSEKLRKWEISGRKTLIFYIVEKDKREEWRQVYPEFFKESFSLSNYQMCPMMENLVLYEQIYRGYRIMHHHPYHK